MASIGGSRFVVGFITRDDKVRVTAAAHLVLDTTPPAILNGPRPYTMNLVAVQA